MSEKKEQALNEVMASFNEMARLVMSQLTRLEKMMNAADEEEFSDLFAEMETDENLIDKMEVVIGEQFTNTIVLFHPVASDLRRLLACYRMSINLERIGDRIINLRRIIAEIRSSDEYASISSLLENMLSSSTMMVEKALLSFINSDPDFAIWTIKNDSVVDEMNRRLLISHIMKSEMDDRMRSMVMSYVELRDMISNIERIADHATNLAEASIYSMQGTDIRHTGIGKEG
ncbi:MAG TPA: PhoU domain-containing protein [Bacteroidales bacterium]|nr:hypothetical protein [Bacteroidales bacterium]HOU95866.1 PhoU domain-containing protein [Bacteroidales bacterium]